ncbi:hypothetical protein [uncultured Chitinophaga sp.]|uniref:hypothetical protein n=1 Tax=uncultured Chitinophaga sp. TaxID=339340 RepID=UPI0025CCF403|nr:hypothetical protein [uncultured Chitinophaga sp.]
MKKSRNIFEMYVDNGCRLGFYVHRESWRSDRYAKVIGIDGVKDGEPIEGTPPYYNRIYPADHPNAGKTWGRTIYLQAPWFDTGHYQTESGGTGGWTK